MDSIPSPETPFPTAPLATSATAFHKIDRDAVEAMAPGDVSTWTTQRFTIVIWGDDRPAFGKPERIYSGKKACAKGRISR